MSSYNRRTVYLGMSCKHKVEIAEPAPEVGAEQYCIRCGDYRKVLSHLTNYRASCKAKCSFGRNFGDDEEKGKVACRKHVGSNPRHTVELFRDGKKVAEFTNVEETLFSTPDEIAVIAKENQAILRKAQNDSDAEKAIALLKEKFPMTKVIAIHAERDEYGF